MSDVINLDAEGAPHAADAPVDPDVVVLAEGAEGSEPKLPKRAKLNSDGSITLALAYPVTMKWQKGQVVTEEVVDHLLLNRFTGADMRAISAAREGSRVVVSIARSARMGEVKMNAIFDRMDGADTTAAGQVVSYFLGLGD